MISAYNSRVNPLNIIDHIAFKTIACNAFWSTEAPKRQNLFVKIIGNIRSFYWILILLRNFHKIWHFSLFSFVFSGRSTRSGGGGVGGRSKKSKKRRWSQWEWQRKQIIELIVIRMMVLKLFLFLEAKMVNFTFSLTILNQFNWP